MWPCEPRLCIIPSIRRCRIRVCNCARLCWSRRRRRTCRRRGWCRLYQSFQESHRRSPGDWDVDCSTRSVDIRARKRRAFAAGGNGDALTWERLVVARTGLENVVPCVGRGVECAPLGVENMLEVARIVCSGGVTGFQTEVVVTHKTKRKHVFSSL